MCIATATERSRTSARPSSIEVARQRPTVRLLGAEAHAYGFPPSVPPVGARDPGDRARDVHVELRQSAVRHRLGDLRRDRRRARRSGPPARRAVRSSRRRSTRQRCPRGARRRRGGRSAARRAACRPRLREPDPVPGRSFGHLIVDRLAVTTEDEAAVLDPQSRRSLDSRAPRPRAGGGCPPRASAWRRQVADFQRREVDFFLDLAQRLRVRLRDPKHAKGQVA